MYVRICDISPYSILMIYDLRIVINENNVPLLKSDIEFCFPFIEFKKIEFFKTWKWRIYAKRDSCDGALSNGEEHREIAV